MAIKRIWHGWTTLENAGAYENLLRTEVFPGIEAKSIPGYRSIELLKREHPDEVEFVTIMTFDRLQNVIDFQGEDYECSYVPDAARKVSSAGTTRLSTSKPSSSAGMTRSKDQLAQPASFNRRNTG